MVHSGASHGHTHHQKETSGTKKRDAEIKPQNGIGTILINVRTRTQKPTHTTGYIPSVLSE